MKHLPTILTVAGCVGVGATVYFAVKVTPEAKRRIDELKEQKETEIFEKCEVQWKKDNGYCPGGEHENETPKDTDLFIGAQNLMDEVPAKEYRPNPVDIIKAVGPLYIPTGLMCGASIAAFVSANSVSVKRLTATSAALTATEEAFRTYKNKVIEQIGEKKAAEVIQKIAKEKVDKNPPKTDENVSGSPIIITGAGDSLCYDSYTGRYFKSDIGRIRQIINNLNERLLREDYISLNEFYDEIGLAHVTMGDELGWNSMRGLIDITYSSILADEEHGGCPCLVIDFLVAPRYTYGDSLHHW